MKSEHLHCFGTPGISLFQVCSLTVFFLLHRIQYTNVFDNRPVFRCAPRLLDKNRNSLGTLHRYGVHSEPLLNFFFFRRSFSKTTSFVEWHNIFLCVNMKSTLNIMLIFEYLFELLTYNRNYSNFCYHSLSIHLTGQAGLSTIRWNFSNIFFCVE